MSVPKAFLSQLAAVGTLSLLIAACGGSSRAAVRVSKPVAASHAAAQSAQDTTTTSGAGEEPTGPRTDLVGDSPGIAIDHTGAYTWTSAVVLPLRPEQLAWSYHVDGEAQISGFGHTLVSVSGGYSLQVWFTVDSFSGSPDVKVASVASGSLPPGLITPPTVATSTSLSGGN